MSWRCLGTSHTLFQKGTRTWFRAAGPSFIGLSCLLKFDLKSGTRSDLLTIPVEDYRYGTHS